MAGTFLGKYDTTSANNTATGTDSVSVAEGMLPSNINNAFRSVMADIRQHYNDAEWIEYGDGAGAYTPTYVSGTSFTIDGVNVAAIYHVGRRVKVTASTPGTIYGSITAVAFSTNTTVTVSWDSGSLSSEAITSVFIGALANTNKSIPIASIATANIIDDAITTAKINADAITGAQIADNAIDSEHYTNGSIDTAHIAADQIVASLIADNAIDSEHYTDGSIDNAHIADDAIDSEHYAAGSIDTAHIADAQITVAKMAINSIDSDQYVDASIDNAHLAADSVTADKIADAVIVTNAEQSGHTPGDTTFFTTSASDGRYFRQDSSETIESGDTWSGSDAYVATTAAIDARIVDLVDDVGGFVAIANETSFPNTNPDVNDGAGTIISIKEIASTRTPSTGTVTISGGTLGASTVTITGCGSTVLTAGYGVLVETSTTLNTYTFHRLTPKATEVTTVASISGDITTVAANDANITSVADDIDTITTNISNITVVGQDLSNNFTHIIDNGAITDSVTSTAGSSVIDLVADDITDVTTVAGQISPTNNISAVAGISADITAVAGISANVTSVAGDATDIGTVATDLAGSNNIGTVVTNIDNVNLVGGSIANVNEVGNNIGTVNEFGERYKVASTDPTTSLDEGDLVYNSTANALKYYNGSAWITVVAGSLTDIVQDGTPQLGGNLDTQTFTVDGRDVSTDGTKLDTIATSATANPNAIDNVVEDTSPQLGAALDGQNNNLTNIGTISGTNLQLDFGGL